jgi:hypothetical protein
VRWISVAVTATHHTILNPPVQVHAHSGCMFAVVRFTGELLSFGSEIFRAQHLANFGFALPARPVFLV